MWRIDVIQFVSGQEVEDVLPWEVRFNVAIAVAEALNHLHNESSRPVIHRDVKSSNILLSSELEPQVLLDSLVLTSVTVSF